MWKSVERPPASSACFFFTTKKLCASVSQKFLVLELRPRWLAAARIGHFVSWWWCRLCKLAGIFPAMEHRPPIPSWFRWINVFHPLDSNLKFPLFFPRPFDVRHSSGVIQRSHSAASFLTSSGHCPNWWKNEQRLSSPPWRLSLVHLNIQSEELE